MEQLNQPKRGSSIVLLLAAMLALSFGGCAKEDAGTTATGGDEDDSSDSDPIESALSNLSLAMAQIAVSSPTAARLSDLVNYQHNHETMSEKFYRFLNPFTFSVADEEEEAQAPDIVTFEDRLDAVEEAMSGDPEDVADDLANFTVLAASQYPPCYGPGWLDDARDPGNVDPLTARPVGDLGMVAEAAGDEDPTACAAAKLNALIAGAPDFANRLILLQATMIAAANEAEEELPDEGESLDLSEDMPEIDGVTITLATLERLDDDSDGNAVYKTSFAFVDEAEAEGSATIYHTPLNEDNTNFKGLLQAILPYSPAMEGDGHHSGLSMVYLQEDGVLTYALDTAANRQTDSVDFFGDNGRVDYTKIQEIGGGDGGFGENGNRIIALFDTNTNQQIMHYAWQAGQMDGAGRAFAVQIDEGDPGALEGRGYFGFSADIAELTDDVSTAWADHMFCDWLQGLADGTSQPFIQGQTFAQDETGIFVPVESHIDFAPNEDCQVAEDFLIDNSSYPSYDGTRSIPAHDLIEFGDVGVVDGVEVPDYDLPDTGIDELAEDIEVVVEP